jgi:Protein of unknown function (DUF3617)
MRLFLILTTTTLTMAACGASAPAAPVSQTAEASGNSEPSGAPPLDAAGVPRVRPGLYEVVQVVDGEAPETRRECVGEDVNAELREILAKRSSSNCKISRSTGPAGLRVATECRQNGMTNRLHLTVAGSDTVYKTTLSIEVTTPNGETSSTTSTMQGRWLGVCSHGIEENG